MYPQITDVRLTDYKVRVLDNQGTAAKVRVPSGERAVEDYCWGV